MNALKSGRPRKPNAVRAELYRRFDPAGHKFIRSAIWNLLDEGKIRLTTRLKLQIKK
ncbi:MAG: hypothetical protein Q8L24_02590 [bacterium]|nr:hypothetical protein [bacterium]